MQTQAVHSSSPACLEVQSPKTSQERTSTIIAIASAAFFLLKLPFQLVYNQSCRLGRYIISLPFEIWHRGNLAARHEALCQRVEKQFAGIVQDGKKIVAAPKSTTHLFRPRKSTAAKLDLRALNRVISIDVEKRTAHVEGGLSFDVLLTEALKVGLRPKIVPIPRKITIGGAIAGLAVDGGSHKYGLFHRSVQEMEILTGEGKRVSASPSANKELFYGFPNSLGSFGYVLSAKIDLVPAKPFVNIEYKKFTHLDEYFDALSAACKSGEYEFIDGAIFSENQMTLVLGKEADKPSQACSNYTDEVFYLAIKEKSRDCLRIENFLYRWDHDSYFSTKNTCFQNRRFRKLLGKYILRSDRMEPLERSLKKFAANVITPFKAPGELKEEIIQDVAVPLRNCASFTRWLKENIGIFPLFVCPIRSDTENFPLWDFERGGDIYCDIGFFGKKKTPYHPKNGFFNRLVEKHLHEFAAKKSLYSRCFFQEDEFANIYNGKAYKDLKQSFDPKSVFPTIFEKCVQHQ